MKKSYSFLNWHDYQISIFTERPSLLRVVQFGAYSLGYLVLTKNKIKRHYICTCKWILIILNRDKITYNMALLIHYLTYAIKNIIVMSFFNGISNIAISIVVVSNKIKIWLKLNILYNCLFTSISVDWKRQTLVWVDQHSA